MKIFVKIAISLLFLLPLQVPAQNIPSRPDPPRLVNDFAGVLSAGEVAALERKLVAFDDSTSNQAVIVTVKTLDGYPIEEFALSILRQWGIGNQATNNGVLIVAAIDDREVRIETGYGLEGAIPDITAHQIITSDIAPAFRSGNYYEGFDRAVNSIIAAAAGEYKAPAGYRDRGKDKGLPLGLIIPLVILAIILLSGGGGSGGGGFLSRRGYRGGFGPIFFPPGGGGFGGFGGSGGGGFGGGGFGGFGGGSGGGGGASGRW